MWGEVKKALSSPEAIWDAVQTGQERLDPGRVESELREAEREIDRLKRQERNLIYLYRVGEYDEQLLEVETKRLKEAQARATARYGELNRELVSISQAADQMESIETYCEWASRNLQSLEFEQKRLVLEALDIRVVVDDKKVAIRGFLPPGRSLFSPASPASKGPG